jgi:regulation of enolase protein 1 (concanavalin A-like superfamily)
LVIVLGQIHQSSAKEVVMCRRSVCLVFFLLVAGLVPDAVHADIQTGLVGYWPLNEGKGTKTADMSGNGHEGTLNNGVTWISPGFIGNAAVRIDGNPGSRVAVGTWDPGERLTLAIWARWTGEQNKAPRTGLIGKRDDWSDVGIRWFSEVMTSGEVRMRNYTQTVSSPAGALTAHINEWAHVAITFDGATARIYLNGVQVGSGAFTLGPLKTAAMGLGCKDGGSGSSTEIFSGDLDEARIYDRALSVADVKQLFEWTGLPGKAQGPQPADGEKDVARDIILSWTPGEFTPATNGHRVYFGENANDVSNGVGAVAQDANTYTPPQRLDFGKTYYWRVDEVNKTPDKPLFKGDVWSFTVESQVYQVRPVTATASSSDAGAGPQNTINGSGLTNGLHSTANAAMWLSSVSGPQPAWIQYAFDGVYKLYEMRVWNYNVVFEPVLGFGFKDVKIEYSTDGTTWTLLKETQFARAPGLDSYAAGTTVDFAGAAAKFVRLTAKSNWGGLVPQFGLSEVQFFYTPVNPRQPVPASGATGVSVNATLTWRAGREAASHQVSFGTDPNAVRNGTAPVKTVSKASFDPGPLEFGKTYYWKVAEVNEAATPKVWAGDVWSFSTAESFVVDDFEGYTDTEGSRIYETWVDGWTNSTGSTVGYVQAPFAERTILHGGKQSMPLDYNNTKSPFYSEAERTWDKPQDWTVNGADTLTLYFRGHPAAFVESAGTITMSGGGTDIWNTADQFRFAYKQLNGDGTITAKVESIDNTDTWAKVGVMIRESVDPGSRFAAVYATPGNGVRYQARVLNGGAATSDTSVATTAQIALKTPVWVKVERKGGSFSGFYSTDGAKWTSMSWNPQTINMGANVQIGLAVTGHDTGTATGVFSGLATTGSVTGSWQVQAVGVAQPANTAAPVYVVVQDSAGKSKMITHPNPAATTLATWQQWRIPLSEFIAGGVKMTAVKKMVIGVGDRSNPKPDGAGKVFIDDIGVGHPAAVNP